MHKITINEDTRQLVMQHKWTTSNLHRIAVLIVKALSVSKCSNLEIKSLKALIDIVNVLPFNESIPIINDFIYVLKTNYNEIGFNFMVDLLTGKSEIEIKSEFFRSKLVTLLFDTINYDIMVTRDLSVLTRSIKTLNFTSRVIAEIQTTSSVNTMFMISNPKDFRQLSALSDGIINTIKYDKENLYMYCNSINRDISYINQIIDYEQLIKESMEMYGIDVFGVNFQNIQSDMSNAMKSTFEVLINGGTLMVLHELLKETVHENINFKENGDDNGSDLYICLVDVYSFLSSLLVHVMVCGYLTIWINNIDINIHNYVGVRKHILYMLSLLNLSMTILNQPVTLDINEVSKLEEYVSSNDISKLELWEE